MKRKQWMFAVTMVTVICVMLTACGDEDNSASSAIDRFDNTTEVAVTGGVSDVGAMYAMANGIVNLGVISASYSNVEIGMEVSKTQDFKEPMRYAATGLIGRSFSVRCTSLRPETHYYYRTYVSVSTLSFDYYGLTESFTTLAQTCVPAVTGQVEEFGDTYVIIGGQTDLTELNEGGVITEVGIEISEDASFESSVRQISSVDNEGKIIAIFTALLPDTHYYYRTYVYMPIFNDYYYGMTESFTTTVRRAVLIEDFTGQRCMNCPAATQTIYELQEAYGTSNVVAVAIHSGSFAKLASGKPCPLMTEIGDEYYNYWGFDYQPVGLVNRKRGSDYSNWAAMVYDELGKMASLNISTMVEYDTKSRSAKIDVKTNGFSNSVKGKLQVWLTEDGITSYQYMPDGNNKDYVHNNVFRDAVNGIWGTDFNIGKGEEKEDTFVYIIDESKDWNVENMHVVVFVYSDNGVEQVTTVPIFMTNQ